MNTPILSFASIVPKNRNNFVSQLHKWRQFPLRPPSPPFVPTRFIGPIKRQLSSADHRRRRNFPQSLKIIFNPILAIINPFITRIFQHEHLANFLSPPP